MLVREKTDSAVKATWLSKEWLSTDESFKAKSKKVNHAFILCFLYFSCLVLMPETNLLSANINWGILLTFKCDGFQVLQKNAAVCSQHPGTDAKSVFSTKLAVHWLDGIGKGKYGVTDKLKLSLCFVAVIGCHLLLAGTVSCMLNRMVNSPIYNLR